MKHFYEHQDDSMRSKLTEHEFEMPQGAWENMTERLDALNQPSAAGTASWSAWFIIGAMLVATTVGLVVYQWQTPFGKKEQPIAEETSIKNSTLSAKNEKQKPISNRAENIQAEVTQSIIKEKPAVDELIPPSPPQRVENDEAAAEDLPQPMAVLNQQDNEEVKDAVDIQNSELSANPELNLEAQPSNNFGHNKPAYTRKTIVTHAFSESTLKWRNNQLPTLSPQPAIQKTQARLLRDTPIIVLENPYTLNDAKNWEFGLSAGLNTKVYTADGDFSLAPVAGAFVRKKLDKQFAIQADLQYKNIRKQSIQNPLGQNQEPDYVYVNVITEAGSGSYEERRAEIYEMRQMHMIELPISFLYQLNTKHQVGMGIKAAYLFGFEAGHEVIDVMKQKELGYNSLDLGALASYEYQISDHFSLGVVYSVGFLNLVKQSSAMEMAYTSTWGANYDMTVDQQAALENTIENGESMMPIRVTEDEQIFLQTPRNMYNSDLRILLRYFF